MKTDVDMNKTTQYDPDYIKYRFACGEDKLDLWQSSKQSQTACVMLIVVHTVELVHDNIKHYNV